jgi:hypothetical protein
MGGLTAPRDVCARQRSLVRNLQHSFKFSNGYGPPDSWFESGSLRHDLRMKRFLKRFNDGDDEPDGTRSTSPRRL